MINLTLDFNDVPFWMFLQRHFWIMTKTTTMIMMAVMMFVYITARKVSLIRFKWMPPVLGLVVVSACCMAWHGVAFADLYFCSWRYSFVKVNNSLQKNQSVWGVVTSFIFTNLYQAEVRINEYRTEWVYQKMPHLLKQVIYNLYIKDIEFL